MKILLALAIGLTAAFQTTAHADGDAAAGAKIFNRCKACHTAEQEQNKIGPHLHGVVGRAAGAVGDFNYSQAMRTKADDGLTWDEASLTSFLTDPKAFVPGTNMAFPGLKKPEDVANVIAYLKSVASQ